MLALSIFAVVMLLSAYACYYIAKKNDMHINTWVAMGFTLGPIGLLMALIVSLFSKKK